MSALILAFIASVCLAVVPPKITNEYGSPDGVTRAATEVIDGHEYAVLDVYSTTTAADINDFVKAHRYTKIMIREDYYYNNGTKGVCWASGHQNTAQVIIDLCGYTVSVWPLIDLAVGCVEFWDSSAAGTGWWDSPTWIGDYVPFAPGYSLVVKVKGGTIRAFTASSNVDAPVTVEVSGGTAELVRFVKYKEEVKIKANLIINGGTVNELAKVLVEQVNVTAAPWVKVNYDAAGNFVSSTTYDAYAVSTTPYASGVYNYAYGYKWGLTAVELSRLAVPTDRTYYLWARNQDGWYEYLNLRYAGGAWQNAV